MAVCDDIAADRGAPPEGGWRRRAGDRDARDATRDSAAAPKGRTPAAPGRPTRRVAPDRSPLARKIILFNLLAMLVLVAGVLFLNPSRDGLAAQRERGLVAEARLLAEVFEASLPRLGPASLAARDGIDARRVLVGVDLPEGVEVGVFDPSGALVARADGTAAPGAVRGLAPEVERTTILTNVLNGLWDAVAGTLAPPPAAPAAALDVAAAMIAEGAPGETAIRRHRDAAGPLFTVVAPIAAEAGPIGTIAVTTAAGEIERLVRVQREQLLQMFAVALAVSIGLSLVLASTIATPLSDLAAAAEQGRDRTRGGARRPSPQRVRIPDLTERPDEIGRLSGALRGMVGALYDRIEANEQFAADVAHEIKNPLASLRSAVGTLTVAKTEEQRRRLQAVIEHDVRRMDRLVSDISNASRLDSELVKEEEEPFDLGATVRRLAEHHAEEAGTDGIDFIVDLPDAPVIVTGLESRLAQVFVNLVTNALSFCEEGDAVRVWMRRRADRVLVVVEDTGPGIPEAALSKVFARFYSERPAQQFGDHSGLGLAISKQIVEAHGGVIWAENIRPTEADPTSDPLGARFVVGLPI